MSPAASPTSVTDKDVATGNSPTKEKKQSMVKRLAGGSFSPSKSSPQNLEESLDDTAAAAKAPEIFVSSEDEATDDDENVDLSVVRSLLGSTFKLDKDTDKDTKAAGGGRAVSFSGVDSPASSKGDERKSTGELLAKITRLELKLKQAELDYSAEKARRKKSSRSTIKLAKEINKRTIEATAQQKAIATLTTANATLDTKLTATRKELDERIAASEIANRDHHMHLSEAQQKYRDTCDENDRRMAEMTKLHNDEVENLRRQLTAQNRDLDMLRGKLVSLEVKEAERIAEHTVYTGIDPTEARNRTWKKQKKNIAIGTVAVSSCEVEVLLPISFRKWLLTPPLFLVVRRRLVLSSYRIFYGRRLWPGDARNHDE
jgi:hypothetical protein